MNYMTPHSSSEKSFFSLLVMTLNVVVFSPILLMFSKLPSTVSFIEVDLVFNQVNLFLFPLTMADKTSSLPII